MALESPFGLKAVNTVSTGLTGLNARVVDNIVFLYTDNNTVGLPTISSAGWTTICTLPESLRPQNMFKTMVSDNSTEGIMTARIKADGSFDVYALAANSEHKINLSCVYFI